METEIKTTSANNYQLQHQEQVQQIRPLHGPSYHTHDPDPVVKWALQPQRMSTIREL